jgi:hypothetical protein
VEIFLFVIAHLALEVLGKRFMVNPAIVDFPIDIGKATTHIRQYLEKRSAASARSSKHQKHFAVFAEAIQRVENRFLVGVESKAKVFPYLKHVTNKIEEGRDSVGIGSETLT